ncbi:MAG: PCC domain-containing protein [Dehalococcoidales bacterium]
MCAKFGKIIPAQLPTREDLIVSIKNVCKENGIRYGAILSIVGSLLQLTIEGVVTSTTSRTGQAFAPPQVIPGPLQVLNLDGIIIENEKGEMDTHVHGTFVNMEGKICGGHLIEGGCPVSTRLVAVIGEIADVSMIERLDPKSGHWMLHVEPL